jgi:hypothetical protein
MRASLHCRLSLWTVVTALWAVPSAAFVRSDLQGIDNLRLSVATPAASGASATAPVIVVAPPGVSTGAAAGANVLGGLLAHFLAGPHRAAAAGSAALSPLLASFDVQSTLKTKLQAALAKRGALQIGEGAPERTATLAVGLRHGFSPYQDVLAAPYVVIGFRLANPRGEVIASDAVTLVGPQPPKEQSWDDWPQWWVQQGRYLDFLNLALHGASESIARRVTGEDAATTRAESRELARKASEERWIMRYSGLCAFGSGLPRKVTYRFDRHARGVAAIVHCPDDFELHREATDPVLTWRVPLEIAVPL